MEPSPARRKEKYDIMARLAARIPILFHGMHTGLQKSPDMLMKRRECMKFRTPWGPFWRVESMSQAGCTAKEKYDIMAGRWLRTRGMMSLFLFGRNLMMS